MLGGFHPLGAGGHRKQLDPSLLEHFATHGGVWCLAGSPALPGQLQPASDDLTGFVTPLQKDCIPTRSLEHEGRDVGHDDGLTTHVRHGDLKPLGTRPDAVVAHASPRHYDGEFRPAEPEHEVVSSDGHLGDVPRNRHAGK